MNSSAENRKKIRFIIFGAGAIGGVVAGYMARAGKDVVLIGRPAHVKAINEQGLRFVTIERTDVLRVPAVTSPSQISFRPDDVVFLSVKGQDTEKALVELKAVAPDLPIFCFQNGVRNEETVSRYFPRVYAVMVSLGAVFLKNGEAIGRYTPPGALIMGRYPTGKDELVERVAQDLRDAGIAVMVTEDVMPYKWGKLMLNLGNAIQAITDSWGEDDNRIAKAGWQEARDLLAQAGIRWVSPRQLAEQWPEGAAEPAKKMDVEARNSTWQSLASQRGTVESDYLNGEIIRVARKLGKQAPVAEALLRICEEMAAKHERPGKYTAAELVRLVGLG